MGHCGRPLHHTYLPFLHHCPLMVPSNPLDLTKKKYKKETITKIEKEKTKNERHESKKPTSAILQRPCPLSEHLKSTSLEFSAFQGIHILPSNAVFHFFLIVLIWQITQVPHTYGIIYLHCKTSNAGAINSSLYHCFGPLIPASSMNNRTSCGICPQRNFSTIR